jgi:hypothetical protein
MPPPLPSAELLAPTAEPPMMELVTRTSPTAKIPPPFAPVLPVIELLAMERVPRPSEKIAPPLLPAPALPSCIVRPRSETLPAVSVMLKMRDDPPASIVS